MTTVDPSARIATGAQIGRDVTIGPYCIVGAYAKIGDGCKLIAHVHVTGHTTIGARTTIHPFASLGSPPQSANYRGGPTLLEIGSDCSIRENVTMNTGTEDGGGVTRVGDHCMFMVGAHVGHDCIVGSHVTMANAALLGGHVIVGDYTFCGGGAGVLQFTRIGEGVMISGVSGVAADVIPFGLVVGHRGVLSGLNVVGLRRRGYKRADMHRLREAYQTLFTGPGAFRERVERVMSQYSGDPVVGKIAAFVRENGKRPLMQPMRAGRPEPGSEDGE